jgi:Secretion system C-terminal sorting domain
MMAAINTLRTIRMNADTRVQIQAFPNPVVNELRIMIPSNWQEKNTTYEIYNSNGVLVSRSQVARAAQVEQLNVQSLGSGNYIIRVTNGQEISTSKFIKH